MHFLKQLWITVLIFISLNGIANDGVFYASGNQLIPINEKDISVKKEILTIKKNGDNIEVNVYYEFFNPKAEKEVLVGFEAAAPNGAVDYKFPSSEHPYIKGFSVIVNDVILPYKVITVSDSAYFINNKFKTVTAEKILEYDLIAGGFKFVYYFNARFKKGITIVKHCYTYKVSNSVATRYDFSYDLVPAKRWANHQIDDFTLIIEMPPFEEFNMPTGFYKKPDEWKIIGTGKALSTKNKYSSEETETTFYIQNGFIVFQKQNFKPMNDLFISSLRDWEFFSDNQTSEIPESFDYKKTKLRFCILCCDFLTKTNDDTSRKILRNLPFARRGYIFKSPELKAYFEKMDWYIPNPNYQPNIDALTEEEKQWLKKLKDN